MSVYAVAQLTFRDRPAYDRYQAAFVPVFKQFNGRVLVADEKPQQLEGRWPYQKIVILEFPDEASFRAFSGSHAYEEIARDRRLGADATVILARGIG